MLLFLCITLIYLFLVSVENTFLDRGHYTLNTFMLSEEGRINTLTH